MRKATAFDCCQAPCSLDFFSFLIFGCKSEQEDNIYAKNFSGVCFPGKQVYHKRKNKKQWSLSVKILMLWHYFRIFSCGLYFFIFSTSHALCSAYKTMAKFPASYGHLRQILMITNGFVAATTWICSRQYQDLQPVNCNRLENRIIVQKHSCSGKQHH